MGMSVPSDTSRHDSKAESNAFALYLKEISKIPLLTRKEEQELARSAKGGDEEAKRRMVASNLRFVVRVARNYRNQGVSLMDLISEGNLGLMRAADKFDVDKGYHFITYAVWWIRQSILKAIAVKSGLIRLPLNRANQLAQLRRLTEDLSREERSEMSMYEAADMLNMDHALARELLQIQTDYVSLDAPLTDEGDGARLGDVLEDDLSDSPDEIAINQTLQMEIRDVLSTLSDKESEILCCRFGLDGSKPLSLKEIGKRFNLTKERIRQIEKRTLEKLRHSSKIRRLRDLIGE
jgi:RNA polymerase primary sigma factor